MQIHRPKIGGAQEDQTNNPKTAAWNSSQPAGRGKVSAGPSRYHLTYLEEAIVLPGTSKDSRCMALFWYSYTHKILMKFSTHDKMMNCRGCFYPTSIISPRLAMHK